MLGKGDSLNPSVYLGVAILIGILIFSFYFDWAIIDPSNTAWLLNAGGDSLQHYLGSYAFRADDWHFPLTKTTLINTPEGVSIIYTDSNPLLSIFFKLIRRIFLPEYQFFGLWFLICWILQSVFSFLILKKLTNDYLFSILAAFLFCLLPAQIHRTMHANLLGFWLILWAIYIYIIPNLGISQKQRSFFIVVIVAAMVHPYLANMCLMIFGTWILLQLIGFIRRRKEDAAFSNFLRFALTTILYSFLFVVILWCLGFFYNRSDNQGLMGFGYYSMNLLSPVNPHYAEFSAVLKPFAAMDGQYEGFNYLGLGVIILFASLYLCFLTKYLKEYKFNIFVWSIFLVILYNSSPDTLSIQEKLVFFAILTTYFIIVFLVLKFKRLDYSFLLIPASICFLIAVSNNAFIGHYNLYNIQLNEDSVYAGLLRLMRSSGRFFWLTIHILLILAIGILYKEIGTKKIACFFIIQLVIIQFADLSSCYKRVNVSYQNYSTPLNEKEQKTILASKEVRFLGNADFKIAEFALLNMIPINNFYTAHSTGTLTYQKIQDERQRFRRGVIDSSALYLMELKDLDVDVPLNLKSMFFNKFHLLYSPYEDDLESNLVITRTRKDSLHYINDLISKNEISIVAVADEASGNLSEEFKHNWKNIYGSNIPDLGYRSSYLAVFLNGKLYKEYISADDKVELFEIINDITVQIMSAGAMNGSFASIKIDGIELSLNERGLNVVSGKHINDVLQFEAISFDTHAINFVF